MRKIDRVIDYFRHFDASGDQILSRLRNRAALPPNTWGWSVSEQSRERRLHLTNAVGSRT